MAIKDPDIFKIIEKIGDHYTNNISNRFIRKAILLLDLQQSEWDRLENLTVKADYYKTQGFQFDELYEMILAAAHFIYQSRSKLVPNIRSMISVGGESVLSKRPSGAPDQEKILRDMAAQTFPVNLEILSDLINELYMKITMLDKQAHGKKRPVYETIPELKEIGKYLVNS